MKQILLFLHLILFSLIYPTNTYAFVIASNTAQSTPSVSTTVKPEKLTFRQIRELVRQEYAPKKKVKAAPKSSGGDKTLGLLAVVFGGLSLLMILMATGKILSLLLGVAAVVCGILGFKKSHYLMSLLGLIFGGIVVLLWMLSRSSN